MIIKKKMIFYDARKRAYIVPTLQVNALGERLYEVYAKNKISPRLSFNTFKKIDDEDIEKTALEKIKALTPRFGARTGNENWVELVQTDKKTRIDSQDKYSAFSVALDHDSKLDWVLNEVHRAPPGDIFDAMQHMDKTHLSHAVQMIKKNMGLGLNDDQMAVLNEYSDPISMRALVHNVLNDPKYEITRPHTKDFQLSRAFASMLASKIQNLHRENGKPDTNGLAMKKNSINQYVEKILQFIIRYK